MDELNFLLNASNKADVEKVTNLVVDEKHYIVVICVVSLYEF